jgi:hypothetical protein
VTDFSYKPTLTGDLVVLRPLDEGDYDAIRTAVDDPDVARLTGSRGRVDEQKAREWMLGLHRISLDVFAFNPRVRRAYEKAGFVAEGVLRDALRWDGD